jgi:endonuclease III
MASQKSSSTKTKPKANSTKKAVTSKGEPTPRPPLKKTIKNGKETKAKSSALVSSQIAGEMMGLLCKLYPDADCELTFKNDYELLTAVILSAQTTDVQVNKVTPKLFAKYPTAQALAQANLDEVKELIKPTGYYNNKAKSIQACASALVLHFAGRVPNTLDDLITLPGVGRKTANVVLGVIHKIPGWTVDTHVQRLSQRLGLTKNSDPYKIELDLQRLFPKQDWTKYSITLIWHGRRLCFARNPDCSSCPLNDLCPSSLSP